MSRPKKPGGIRQAPGRALGGLAGLAILLAAGAPLALGHDRGGVPAKKVERELRGTERRVLGNEHAAEHALERRATTKAAEAWRRMSPEERVALDAREARVQELLVAAAGPAAETGAWTTAPFPIPNFAIHSAVLPTGKVLFWGYPPYDGGSRPNSGEAAIWDPSKGTGPASLREIPPPKIDVDGDGTLEPAPIYCSGQSFLPSGALLVAGGNLVWPNEGNGYSHYSGHERVFTFNPWTETWREQPGMEHGRWYPSQVELADGRNLIVSGYDEDAPGGSYNEQLEVFTGSDSPGGAGTIARQPSGDRSLALYPHLFTLPDGDVLLAGGGRYESSILDTGDFSWHDLPPLSRSRDAGPAVLLPGGPTGSSTAMELGGYDLGATPEADGAYPATRTTETIDASASGPEWQRGPSLNLQRSNMNVVLLPDGSMVTVGGGRGWRPDLGGYLIFNNGRLRQVELYDPATDSWRLGPPQEEDRAYHSTAVLLPDGRVMSAGDDYHPTENGGFSSSDTAEIYSPPYLFSGSRPVIDSAPSAVRWGDEFGVRSASPEIERAVLMAPAATTHSVDMQQRHVELRVVRRLAGRGVDVVAPPSGGVAPPGHYMLFLLNGDGVPSVATWVKVSGDAADQPSVGARLRARVRVKSRRRLLRRRGIVVLRVSANRPTSVNATITVGPGRRAPAVALRRIKRPKERAARKLRFHFRARVRRRAGARPMIRLRLEATDANGERAVVKRSFRLRP